MSDRKSNMQQAVNFHAKQEKLDSRAQEILDLTKQLVQIPSVNSTDGEKQIGLFLEQYLRSIPYFKEHPDQVVIEPLEEDALGRRNVFAYLVGGKSTGDTILLHGHTDTVGVEDYGTLQDVAFQPDKLMEELKHVELPDEVREDLLSGDYLFGRGSCDMKSGDAVFLVLLKELSEQVDKLSGNIMVSFNPVEENMHTGIIEGLNVLNELKEKKGFRYLFAINNDYICPLYEGDSHRYIYTGTVGKLLPCFYIHGKETHVGQCFEGFDASMIAARLVERISGNTEFCDGYQGEYSLPPTVLKCKDLKLQYNVQTAKEAFVYYNFFVHNRSVNEITALLKEQAASVLKESLEKQQEEQRKYAAMTGLPFHPFHLEYDILTYEELVEEFKREQNEEVLKKLKDMEFSLSGQEVEKREAALELVRVLVSERKSKNPVVVLFYAGPYCPHNTLTDEVPEEAKLKAQMRQIVTEFGQEVDEEYQVLNFFPSLSDSSYIKVDDDLDSIQTLIHNFPAYDVLYPLPLEEMKKLNLPAFDFGCYGKDAHKWTERVNLSYSFVTLPALLEKVIAEFLG